MNLGKFRRSRLVSLRLTDEEYNRLRQATAQAGARCVSDYARKALLDPKPKDITSLEERIARLEARLAPPTCDSHS